MSMVVGVTPTTGKIGENTNHRQKTNVSEEDINLSILDKVKLIDTLDKDEKACLLKMIDITIAKKKMKDNLATLMQD